MGPGIEVDERTGQATGVHYIRGRRARGSSGPPLVALAVSIETPRLLLNRPPRRFPDGLCNDFDQVGRT